MLKVAFLDRDGVLIYEPKENYQIDSLDKFRIVDGVVDGLKALIQKGYYLVMVSNQNGIGLPNFPTKAFQIVHWKMLDFFEQNGIVFDQIFICPHLPEDGCDCRKPKTGLVDAFFDQNSVDRRASFMYGDRDTDRQFAENLGIRFFGVETNAPFAIPISIL